MTCIVKNINFGINALMKKYSSAIIFTSQTWKYCQGHLYTNFLIWKFHMSKMKEDQRVEVL